MLPWLAASLAHGWGSSHTSSIPPESAAMESLATVLVVVSDRPATGSPSASRIGDARLLAAMTTSRPGVDPTPFLIGSVGIPASVGWADPLALSLSRRGPPPPGTG
jgi:hypothetical protein